MERRGTGGTGGTGGTERRCRLCGRFYSQVRFFFRLFDAFAFGPKEPRGVFA